MIDQVIKLPNSFYVIIGVMVIGNLSVLITVISFIFKAGMFVSDTRKGIEHARDCAVRAHKRIDVIESKKGD